MRKSNQIIPMIFSVKSKQFIKLYDKKNHKVWNETKGMMLRIRKEIRNYYIPKQRYLCAYCREEKVTTDGRMWEVDHILPKSKMPTFMYLSENLIACCHECNTNKSDNVGLVRENRRYSFLPPDGGYYKIIHPHYDKYSKHMKIYLDGSRRIYKPVTRKGRETFKMCGLDRFACKVYGIQQEIIRKAQLELLLSLYVSGDIPKSIYENKAITLKSTSLGGALCINVDFNHFYCSKRVSDKE